MQTQHTPRPAAAAGYALTIQAAQVMASHMNQVNRRYHIFNSPDDRIEWRDLRDMAIDNPLEFEKLCAGVMEYGNQYSRRLLTKYMKLSRVNL